MDLFVLATAVISFLVERRAKQLLLALLIASQKTFPLKLGALNNRVLHGLELSWI